MPVVCVAWRLSFACLVMALLSGCVSDGGPSPSSSLARADGATIAFESIDGPPPPVFDRLVGALDSEAKLRGVPVVSREGSAAFRARGYLSAQVRGARTTIAWTWDIYDRNQQRALRISGEEVASRRLPDAWSTADDLVVRRIAQASLSGLSGLLSGTSTPQAPASPGTGPAVAEGAVASAEAPSLGFNSR